MIDKVLSVILIVCLIFVIFKLGELKTAVIQDRIIQEKHIPSYIDADCILQLMEE